MQVAGHPGEITRDVFVAHDGVDLRNRREPRIPRGLRVIAAESVDELAEPRVGDHRQMRAGMRGVVLDGFVAFEDRHRPSRPRQQVRSGQPGNAGADDDDVGLSSTFQSRQARQGGRVHPMRLRPGLMLHPCS